MNLIPPLSPRPEALISLIPNLSLFFFFSHCSVIDPLHFAHFLNFLSPLFFHFHTSYFGLIMSSSNITNTGTPLSSSTSGATSASDLPPLVTERPPRVLIAGGGLGGLFLGILMERAGIPYEIFERSAEIKPLGMSQLPLSLSLPLLYKTNESIHYPKYDI